MSKMSDLTGKIFNRLTVVSYSHTHQGNSYWLCKCECSNETIVAGCKLTTSSTKSCGCLNNDRFQNLVGQTFGKLSVLSLAYREDRKSFFNCACSCGNNTIVRSDLLKSGHTSSCGCYHSERISGFNSHFWKGGVTDYNEKQRKSPDYRKVRYSIIKRDKKCKVCSSDKNLRVHHLSSFATDEQNRLNPNNLVTLCLTCHLDFHKKYGKTGNSYYQFVLYFLGKRKCLDHKITKF